MKHLKTYKLHKIFENKNLDEYILPKGSVLYHGSVEDFDLPLTVGGYDKVLWTAKSEIIAKMYIPVSSKIYTSTELISRPISNSVEIDKFLKSIGVIYSDVKKNGNQLQSYKLEFVGDATFLNKVSDDYYTLQDTMIEKDKKLKEILNKAALADKNKDYDKAIELYDEAIPLEKETKEYFSNRDNPHKQLLKYINSKLEDLGYIVNQKDEDKRYKLKIDDDEVKPYDYRSEGRLFKLTAKQDIKFFDIAKKSEGDLTDLDYHKLDLFRKAEKDGYNGIRINDFAQSEQYGNYGHLSYGIFKNSIQLFDVEMIGKAYHPNEKELEN